SVRKDRTSGSAADASADLAELGGGVVAEQRDGGDAHDRDERDEQCVLDEARAFLVPVDLCLQVVPDSDDIHGWAPWGLNRASPETRTRPSPRCSTALVGHLAHSGVSRRDAYGGSSMWLLDLDGVVWLSDQPIPGAVEAVARLRGAGERVLFLTNNSSARVGDYLDKLTGLGIPTA